MGTGSRSLLAPRARPARLASVRAIGEAGDASDLDAAMTEVTLGQLRSALLTESIVAVRATLELRATNTLGARMAAAAQQRTAAQPRVALAQQGILPTFGITVPLPIFDRGGAEVAAARATTARATAELAVVRRETDRATLAALALALGAGGATPP